MTKPCLAFDVETIPDPRIIHDPDLCEEVRNNVALGNTKDPAKIEAKRDEIAIEHEGQNAQRALARACECAYCDRAAVDLCHGCSAPLCSSCGDADDDRRFCPECS